MKPGESCGACGPNVSGKIDWSKGNFAELKDKMIRLRFTLRNASFYSYWVGKSESTSKRQKFVSLFDGKSLTGWEITKFGAGAPTGCVISSGRRRTSPTSSCDSVIGC